MNKIKVLIVCVMFIGLTACGNKVLKLKENEITLEAGEKLNQLISYLNIDKGIDQSLIQAQVVGSDKDILPVGDYSIQYHYQDEDATLKVHVQDTVAPKVTVKGKYEMYKNGLIYLDSLKALLDIQDVSLTETTFDQDNVDVTKEGNYSIVAQVKDAGNNIAEAIIPVVVKKPVLKVPSTLKMYVNTQHILVPTIKGFEKKATYSSSNKDVAEIDSTGKINAHIKGTTTITVKANGLTQKCKVTVKYAEGTYGNKKVVNKNTGKEEYIYVYKPAKKLNETSACKEVFNRINKERTKRGLKPYQWNSNIAVYAKMRAKETSIKYSHIRPNGSIVDYAEIIGPRDTPAIIVRDWMASPSHKDVILDADKTQCGVGCYYADGTYYWVANMEF